MSKFYIPIPVDLQKVADSLPKDSFVHGVVFNEAEKRVEVHFEHDGFSTGLDHAVEFKAEEFGEPEPESEPKGAGQGDVQAEPAAAAAPTGEAAAPAVPAAKPAKPVKPAKAVRTLKAKAAARKNG
ncbi:MAG TPA: hypothetical protein VHA37_04495 [Candidatus Saccharimonadales bacterium]|nr:hypothetical protein [Candidatus Saccharimonadales bacterium]